MISPATPTDLKRRFHQLPGPSLADELELTAGSLRDYRALSEHHYRAKAPATATRVLVLRQCRPTVVGRFTHRPDQPRVVGVLVESLPSLSCRMRDWALHDRYGSWLAPKSRAMLLNRELRCISRVVIAPPWRGLGLAVRLVRAALDDPTTAFTEALAAMGKVHPFFERAGMTAYPRPPHDFDTRLRDALASVGIAGCELAMLDTCQQRIQQLPGAHRGWLRRELHRWYRKNAGRSSVHSSDPDVHLKAAQERLLFEPVYYLKVNL